MRLEKLNINIPLVCYDNKQPIELNKNFLIYKEKYKYGSRQSIIDLKTGKKVDFDNFSSCKLVGDFLCLYRYNSEFSHELYDENLNLFINANSIRVLPVSERNYADKKIIKIWKEKKEIIMDFNGKILNETKSPNYENEEDIYRHYIWEIEKYYCFHDGMSWLADEDDKCISEKYKEIKTIDFYNDKSLAVAENMEGKKGCIDSSGKIAIPFDYIELKKIYSNADNTFFATIKKVNAENGRIIYKHFIINYKNQILYEFLDDLLYKKDIKKAYFLTNRLYVEYSKTEEYYDSYDEETRSRTTYGKKYYPIENMKNIENYIDVRYVDFEHPEHDFGYNKKQCYDLKKNKKIEYYESYSRPTKDKIYKTFKNLNHVLFEVRYNIYQPRKDWRKYDAEILGYSFTYNLDDVLDKPEYKNYYKVCEYYCVQNYNDKFGIIDTHGKVIISCDYDKILISENNDIVVYKNSTQEYYKIII